MSEPLTGWKRVSNPLDAARSSSQTLLPLFEVNEEALTLLAAHAKESGATASFAAPMVQHLRTHWRALDAVAIRHAAQCPVLLVDFDLTALNQPGPVHSPPPAWCSQASAVRLMREALTLIWYLCRMDRKTASIRLGLPPAAVHAFQNMRLHQIESLAELKYPLLRPRWTHRQDFWKSLLFAAQLGCERSLNEAKIQALHLLISELSAGPQSDRTRTNGPASAADPA